MCSICNIVTCFIPLLAGLGTQREKILYCYIEIHTHSEILNVLDTQVSRYGREGTAIESRWRRDFPYPSRPAQAPSHPPVLVVLVFFSEAKRQGRGFHHPLPSSADIKQRVAICVCSPPGPSWPLLG
jgi:hypothetical protein